MRRQSALVAILFCLTAVFSYGQGPEQEYVQIYLKIQDGDSLAAQGHSKAALQDYQEAQAELRQLANGYPRWNEKLVQFRLDYLQKQIEAVSAELPKPPAKEQPEAATKGSPGPATPPEKATPAAEAEPKVPPATVQQVGALQSQIQALSKANAQLEAKLKEALSAQPAPVDPRQLAETRARLVELEKENQLLKVTLDQRQKPAGPAQAPAQLTDQIKELQQKLAQQSKVIDALKLENEVLKKQSNASASAGGKTVADLQRKLDQTTANLATVQEERDNLRQQVEQLSKAQAGATNTSNNGIEPEALKKALEVAQARLAVYEANAVPYTPEELALFQKPKVEMSAETKPAKKSLADLPPGVGPLVGEAQRAFMARDYKKAEDRYNQVLRQDENNVYVLANLAATQFEMGDLAAAEKNVQKALTLDPDDAASLYLLGVLRLRQEKFDEALDALSRSAKLNPQNAVTQNSLGIALSQKGMRREAETAFRKALQLEPGYAEAHYNLAVEYALQNPPSKELARWHYQKALSGGHSRNETLEKKLEESASSSP